MQLRLPLFLLMIFLQACSSYPTSIVSLMQPPSIKITTHQVEQGDTLYSIAWRYDLTVDVLAGINQLKEPYMIKQGQVLHLDPQLDVKSGSDNQPPSTVSKITETVQSVGREIITIVKKPTKTDIYTNVSRSSKELVWQPPVQGKVVEEFNPKELRKGSISHKLNHKAKVDD